MRRETRAKTMMAASVLAGVLGLQTSPMRVWAGESAGPGKKAPPSAVISAETRSKVAALIKQLNDQQFSKREEATRTLAEMGGKIFPLIQRAAKEAKIPEVRIRLGEISHRIGLGVARGKDGAASARAFVRAMGKGDIKDIEAFYADKVVLKRGSELLKPAWGLAESRDKDVVVEKAELVKGLALMIKRAGKDKWASIFGKIKGESILVSTAKEAEKPFGGVRPGDTVLIVRPKKRSNDRLTWVFRRTDTGEWLIALEATDY